jgi:hypothetical protein
VNPKSSLSKTAFFLAKILKSVQIQLAGIQLAAHKSSSVRYRRKMHIKMLQAPEKGLAAVLLAPQTGLEPAAFRLGGGPSIQLRYWGLCENIQFSCRNRFEPSTA